MRRFLLCDDCLDFSHQFSDTIKQAYPNDVEIHIITHPLTYNGSYDFDAYFLDIEMPDISGFDFARKIREEHNNAIVLFVTSQRHLVYDSFDVHPYDFIEKQCSLELLVKKCEQLEDKLVTENRSMKIVQGSKITKVYFDDIIYMQKVHNDLYIKTTHQEIRFRKSLKEMCKNLPIQFFKVDSATIVNLHHVVKIEHDSLVMKSNQRLFLNRRGRKRLKETYLNM